jgi:hypothetical protein
MNKIRIYDNERVPGKKLVATFTGFDAEERAKKQFPEDSRFLWLR